MTWQEVLVGYALCGAAAYLALMVVIPAFETKSPEAKIQNLLAEFRNKQDERNNPGWKGRLHHASALVVAHALAALLIVIAWPVAILWKAKIWLSQRKEVDLQ